MGTDENENPGIGELVKVKIKTNEERSKVAKRKIERGGKKVNQGFFVLVPVLLRMCVSVTLCTHVSSLTVCPSVHP